MDDLNKLTIEELFKTYRAVHRSEEFVDLKVKDLRTLLDKSLNRPEYHIYDPITDTAFCGTVPCSEMFTGEELSELVGLTDGELTDTSPTWLKFYVGPDASCNKEGGKPYYLLTPLRSLRHNLSWDHVNAAGVARGDVKSVSKGGNTYKVRLLSGGNSQNAQTNPYNNLGRPMLSEWNRLIYRVHQTVPDGTEDASGGPQVGDNWARFSDSELGVNSRVSPNGSVTWCMEDWYKDSSGRVFRGGYSVAVVNMFTSSLTHVYFGWRPALVRILDKPV